MITNLGAVASRVVVVAEPDTTVQAAAQLMREHHVGALIVVDAGAAKGGPVGIVTDRDLVIEIMATGLDPAVITVEDISTPRVATARESDGIFEGIETMRREGVRRLPVVDGEGRLIGIVTMDDILDLLAQEMSHLSDLIRRSEKRELRLRPSKKMIAKEHGV